MLLLVLFTKKPFNRLRIRNSAGRNASYSLFQQKFNSDHNNMEKTLERGFLQKRERTKHFFSCSLSCPSVTGWNPEVLSRKCCALCPPVVVTLAL